MLLLGVMQVACQRGPGAPPENISPAEGPSAAKAASCAAEDDPFGAVEAWIASAPRDVAARQALEGLGEAPQVARAWRAGEGRWLAIVSSSAEPAPDAPALEVEVQRDAGGRWRVIRAQPASADTGWVSF